MITNQRRWCHLEHPRILNSKMQFNPRKIETLEQISRLRIYIERLNRIV